MQRIFSRFAAMRAADVPCPGAAGKKLPAPQHIGALSSETPQVGKLPLILGSSGRVPFMHKLRSAAQAHGLRPNKKGAEPDGFAPEE
jgi:hypothetical protein